MEYTVEKAFAERQEKTIRFTKNGGIWKYMTELLAPAGSMEAFRAAIANGCDAVYLGMQKFGARAYSCNFDEAALAEAVAYAHIRDVKVYVTMNTIVFEEELADMRKQLDFLNKIGVDGVIVQDMAVFDYIVNNFLDMEAHCSTQMGIDDLDGTLFWKERGAKRVVLAREVDIEKAKKIRRDADVEIEIFVHGALCVSYSGNCLMSGLIGYRSGNRGRCVGSCRKLYELTDKTSGKSLGKSYILSTKDLNTIEHIEELRALDSLKIEGRMKEPAYVANVVSKYRKALDGAETAEDRDELKKTFNRTFTRGYLFGEDPKKLTNIQKPNNFGYEIGEIGGLHKGMYEIRLHDELRQNDIIRIDHDGEDVNLSVVKLYDKAGNLISGANSSCYIRIKEKLSKGDRVYKTKDYNFYKELEKSMDGEYRHFPLKVRLEAYPGTPLRAEAEGLGVSCVYVDDELLETAENRPTTSEQAERQFAKLGDTVFELESFEFEECGAYIPAKLLNKARRSIVDRLYEEKVKSKARRVAAETAPEGKKTLCGEAAQFPRLTAAVVNREQYEACKEAGIEEIYFDNIVRRNQIEYAPREGELLIGGYGGLHYYKDRNPFVTDYSFNVVNSVSCRKLHELGARRVTLSYELNRRQIADLIAKYKENYGEQPALEMIVYGRAPLLFTKYCPLGRVGECGRCKTHHYELSDEYGTFPILSNGDCTTTILNGKFLNLLDEMPQIGGVEAFRLNFTTESADEVLEIARAARKKLSGRLPGMAEDSAEESLFRSATDTRGHFNREIL